MKTANWKRWAVYLPLPLIMIAVGWMCWWRLELFPLLLREMILVFGYLAAVGDAREKLVPNRLILIMLAAWAIVLVPQLLMHLEQTIPILISSLLGALLGGLVFLSVYLLSRHGLGGGDVKFMTAAGLYLGISGVMPTMLVGSVLGAVTGVSLILMKKLERKGTIALVPFLYIGIVLTMLFR